MKSRQQRHGRQQRTSENRGKRQQTPRGHSTGALGLGLAGRGRGAAGEGDLWQEHIGNKRATGQVPCRGGFISANLFRMLLTIMGAATEEFCCLGMSACWVVPEAMS